MRIGAAARCGPLVLSLALAGCGGSVHKSPLPTLPKHVAASSSAPQLVSVRRTNGATWQTVVVRTDGTGYVAIFIGERGGNTHKDFQLGGRELGQLQHLAAIANDTPEKVRRRTLQVGTGHEPHQLTPLTRIVDGLIDQYS